METVRKPDGRGGYRPNAGRKPTVNASLSSYQVARMLRKARRYAKKHGKDIDDLLLDWIYSENEKVRDRLAAVKLFKDCTMPQIKEGGEADKSNAPAVFLPAQHPRLKAVEKTEAA